MRASNAHHHTSPAHPSSAFSSRVQFRWAIWNYVFRTKGVINDEYMYEEVNKLIKKPLKTFVKTVVCQPEACTRRQFDMCIDLQDTEKVHVVLLAVEARKQAEMLYALSALMRYMT